jgi:hypothetical protein
VLVALAQVYIWIYSAAYCSLARSSVPRPRTVSIRLNRFCPAEATAFHPVDRAAVYYPLQLSILSTSSEVASLINGTILQLNPTMMFLPS